jgi:proteasome lid subunit RPN8/RPN11
MTMLRCSTALIDQTLESLRAAGRRGTEGVVLWLAKRPLADDAVIVETFVPEHTAEVDVFRIPPSGMSAMMAHLRARKLVLAAQVHSHPAHAFHSKADDAWAIVRHEGALSIVVPYFAAGVTARNFLERSATFRLSNDDRWLPVRPSELPERLELDR